MVNLTSCRSALNIYGINMLKVTIDLIPFGIGKPKTLKEFYIANDGTGTTTKGNYKVKMKDIWKEKAVLNYSRQSYPVSKLVYLALKDHYENGN